MSDFNHNKPTKEVIESLQFVWIILLYYEIEKIEEVEIESFTGKLYLFTPKQFYKACRTINTPPQTKQTHPGMTLEQTTEEEDSVGLSEWSGILYA